MDIKEILSKAEKDSSKIFEEIDNIALINQKKILDAFKKNSVAERHMKGTTGYGYDDIGRDTLAKVFADVFEAESAIVSPKISTGTEALTIGLFGLLRPNDILLSITGAPYDTLMDVIEKKGNGSLSDFGIKFSKIDLLPNGEFDFAQIIDYLKTNKTKVVYITRSRGYTERDSISVQKISEIIRKVKDVSPDTYILVDNCYGEFTDITEPSAFGADLTIGSLIKNAGGGIAPTGGYLVGTEKAVELASYRLTTPSLGAEVGSFIHGYLPYYEGLFLAPQAVKNAMKGAVLWAKVFTMLGYKTFPKGDSVPKDIISAITLEDKDKLIAICQAVQLSSPIDSYVMPEPWDMPGYNEQVIMAAGTFISGASIELSSDAPIKAPYVLYIQGGLTYEHIKLTIENALKSILSE